MTHGFVDVGNGNTATTVDDPLAPAANNQLLGLDQTGNEAAGFYTDAMGVTHAYTYTIPGGTFTSLPTGLTNGPTVGENSMATGVNDAGMVAGFDMPSGNVADGFLFSGGVYQSIQYPGSTFTQPLGLNDNGEVVGTYTDMAGVIHAFTYLNGVYTSFDAPGALTMTTANGVNDNGDIVGFFMNASGATVGFEAVPTPEPSTITMFSVLCGTALAMAACRFRRNTAASSGGRRYKLVRASLN